MNIGAMISINKIKNFKIDQRYIRTTLNFSFLNNL